MQLRAFFGAQLVVDAQHCHLGALRQRGALVEH